MSLCATIPIEPRLYEGTSMFADEGSLVQTQVHGYFHFTRMSIEYQWTQHHKLLQASLWLGLSATSRLQGKIYYFVPSSPSHQYDCHSCVLTKRVPPTHQYFDHLEDPDGIWGINKESLQWGKEVQLISTSSSHQHSQIIGSISYMSNVEPYILSIFSVSNHPKITS